MPDVFISYAREDEREAGRVADALREQDYDVWRDDQLPAHRTYADVIEERLTSAKAVVVLWSAKAARSQWVRAEADTAREAGTLVQLSVDGTAPPLPFNQIQCADLRDWSGATDAPGWRKVKDSVASLVGRTAGSLGAQASQRDRGVSVCVLPFANMSGDPEQEYFSDGISEDITTDLSQISALPVIARNTAFMFKGAAVDVADVARKLSVSHVLEGSVRKAGSRVRITAQLIDGTSGEHVWAERYDRDLTDIFEIQDEISKAIVAALKLRLLPAEKKAIEDRGTTSADAYNLYLMARRLWISGNQGDRRREDAIIRLCERAVEIDPSYAHAWALMALAQSNLPYQFGVSGVDGGAAADRALSLDPNIAAAYCVKSRQLSIAGELEDAMSKIAEGLRLDPDSWEVNKEAARLHMQRREIADATRHYEKAVEAMDADYSGWGMLLTCYRAIADEEGIRRAAGKTVELTEAVIANDPTNGGAMAWGANGLAILGHEERAKEWIERALLLDPDNLNMRYNFACVLANELHDKERALQLLERMWAENRGVHIVMAETDPDLDSLRDDPRFQKTLAAAKKRLGLV